MVRLEALRVERPEPPLRLANDLLWIPRGSNAIVSSQQQTWGNPMFQLRVQGGRGWRSAGTRRVQVG